MAAGEQELWRRTIARENRARCAHIIASRGGDTSALALRPPRAWDAHESFGEAVLGGEWTTRLQASGRHVHYFRGMDGSGERSKLARADDVNRNVLDDATTEMNVPPAIPAATKPRHRYVVRGRGDSDGVQSWPSTEDPLPVPLSMLTPPATRPTQRRKRPDTTSRLAIPESAAAKVEELLAHPRTRAIGQRLQESYVLHRSSTAPVPVRSRKDEHFSKLHTPIAENVMRGGWLVTPQPMQAACKADPHAQKPDTRNLPPEFLAKVAKARKQRLAVTITQ